VSPATRRARRTQTTFVRLASARPNVVSQPGRTLFFPAELDDERQEHPFIEWSDRELNSAETLADAIESIGEKTGWDSLSDWDEEHLESDENSGDGVRIERERTQPTSSQATNTTAPPRSVLATA
jgi:hypothetical protein